MRRFPQTLQCLILRLQSHTPDLRSRHAPLQQGAQTVEYAILTLLVVVVLLVAVEGLFGAISDLITRAREGISQVGG